MLSFMQNSLRLNEVGSSCAIVWPRQDRERGPLIRTDAICALVEFVAA